MGIQFKVRRHIDFSLRMVKQHEFSFVHIDD